jgi:hypothetical protein
VVKAGRVVPERPGLSVTLALRVARVSKAGQAVRVIRDFWESRVSLVLRARDLQVLRATKVGRVGKV